ncbi:MAG: hypothetical protein RR569_10025, partial [Acinetobacter sp.]
MLCILGLVIIYSFYFRHTLDKSIEQSIKADDKVKECGIYLGIETVSGATRGSPSTYLSFKRDLGNTVRFKYIPKYHDQLIEFNKLFKGSKVCYSYSLNHKDNQN